MTGYPWAFDAPLTSTDLNKAIGLALTTANAASASALSVTATAQGAATQASAAVTVATSANTNASAANNTANNANNTANAASALATQTQQNLAPVAITVNWPNIPVVGGTYVLTGTAPYGFTVTSADASIGSAGGSMIVGFKNGPHPIQFSFTLTQFTKTNFPATGPFLTVNPGTTVSLSITVASGAPADAYVTLNGTRT